MSSGISWSIGSCDGFLTETWSCWPWAFSQYYTISVQNDRNEQKKTQKTPFWSHGWWEYSEKFFHRCQFISRSLLWVASFFFLFGLFREELKTPTRNLATLVLLSGRTLLFDLHTRETGFPSVNEWKLISII